jgi:hypothetical protein
VKQVAFEPPLQGMLAEHFHHSAVRRELTPVGVLGKIFAEPSLFCDLVERGKTVSGVLVRAEDSEVARVGACDIAQKLTQYLGRRDLGAPGLLDLNRIVAEFRQP